jgi:DNA-binding protein YbaB
MLDNMKMLGALSGLLKNRDKIAGAGDRVKSKMHATRIVTTAGGGSVRATVNGLMQVETIDIAPSLSAQQAGPLIVEAVNDGIRQAQAKMKEAVDAEMKGLGFEGGLPDIGGLSGLLR